MQRDELLHAALNVQNGAHALPPARARPTPRPHLNPPSPSYPPPAPSREAQPSPGVFSELTVEHARALGKRLATLTVLSANAD